MTLGSKERLREAIGFEIEHQVERAARNPVLVDRHVVAGEGVVGTALRFHELVELARRALAGAVEHHVFEEMREPGDAGHFVAAADTHPVVQRHVRDIAVGPDDDLHAIGQRGRLDLVGAGHPRWRRGFGGGDGTTAQGNEQQEARESFGMRHLERRCVIYHSQKKNAAQGGSPARREEANTGEELFAVLLRWVVRRLPRNPEGDGRRAARGPVVRRWARSSRCHHDDGAPSFPPAGPACSRHPARWEESA